MMAAPAHGINLFRAPNFDQTKIDRHTAPRRQAGDAGQPGWRTL